MTALPSGFEACATAHYVAHWHAEPVPRRLDTGRFHQLPSWFHVLEFRRPRAWCYATVGMSAGEPDGIEAYIAAPGPHPRAVEFLYALAHFHRTGARLGLGHTVNFGEALWDGSRLDHGLLSFPYPEPESFAAFHCDGVSTTVAWLLPITSAERDYKRENGVEALETLFEDQSLDYLNPMRAAVV